ncbi:MAG: helix-turn-helix transcriptional regulator [Syntrophomonas sp.]
MNLRIKQLRRQQNLTLQQLSELSGVSNGYISDLENGKEGNPSLIILQKIATGLGVTIPELFEAVSNEGES